MHAAKQQEHEGARAVTRIFSPSAVSLLNLIGL
jgi:hypothetical protein